MSEFPSPQKPSSPPSGGYWFRAKRYGYGWGMPQRWQGWVVLISFVAALYLIVSVYNPRLQTLQYCLAMTATIAAFLLICWWKGEPARWRWGGSAKVNSMDEQNT